VVSIRQAPIPLEETTNDLFIKILLSDSDIVKPENDPNALDETVEVMAIPQHKKPDNPLFN